MSFLEKVEKIMGKYIPPIGLKQDDWIDEATEAILQAAREELVPEWKPAHTYASENAEIYRAYDKGFKKAIQEMKERLR